VTFVGRTRAVRRLGDALDAAARGSAQYVLVSGEAGIGKTTLVAAVVARGPMLVGWGTAADAERTPAFWPWTCALRALLPAVDPAALAALPGADVAEVARLLPELGGDGPAPDPDGDAAAARLRLFDAVARFLERLARLRPLAVVLDDLQWADTSSLQLLRFLTQAHRPVPLVVIGAYRHDEVPAEAARTLAEVSARGESVHLQGLDAAEVRDLVATVAGTAAADRWAHDVHRRTGGHPFFARQLAELMTDAGPSGEVPSAVHDLVADRVARLPDRCRALVEAAAVAGNELVPGVLAEVCELDAATVAGLIEDGVRAGVLVRGSEDDARARLAHDLVRETVWARLPVARRLTLHRRLADALEARHARGVPVVPADVARHSAAAVPVEGAERAVRWARRAAAAERARLAFDEAAAHIARARRAIEDAGDAESGGVLVDLLVDEADARARAGDPARARELLADATGRATVLGNAERLGRVALGVQRLGSRFAMPRADVIDVLDAARRAVHGSGTALEAELTASLARELHHSVPGQRARARPLSEEALALARKLDDPATLAACLLARHDVLWTPGRAGERIAVAREIAALAERSGDAERRAEGLLLTANALLEDGSPAFRAVLTEYLTAVEAFGQPRYDYLALTRRGALALIDGRLDDAETLIDEATALGERIGEPDTGNVRMSQLLGLVRGLGDPQRLRGTAADAIRHWVGVPSHAHAVAAGFFVLAGGPDDLAAARQALDTVLALRAWRDDRSYLWSVFVGGMATAAVGLRDDAACEELLAELEPVTDTCGVNGALVCFMGSNAHWAGLLAGALGRTEDARRWLGDALAVHLRLGARVWAAETERALAELEAGPAGEPAAAGADAELRRDGELWRVAYRGRAAHLRDLKGLADLAVLLARPHADVHVLELAGAGPHDRTVDVLLDGHARAAYRRRLGELDDEVRTARERRDVGLLARLQEQRTALADELRRATGLAGRPRSLGTSTSERARKAVTARLREAISRIEAVLPELGAHLDRSVVTGLRCRYEPERDITWSL
jgi:hypothetical protein